MLVKDADAAAKEGASGGYYDSLHKIDSDVDMLFPVTENARRRMIRRLKPEDASRAMERGGFLQSVLGGGSGGVGNRHGKELQMPGPPQGGSGANAAASAASDATAAAAGATQVADAATASAADGTEATSTVGSSMGAQDLMAQGVSGDASAVAAGIGAPLDVDEREEFNSFHFWRIEEGVDDEDELPPPPSG